MTSPFSAQSERFLQLARSQYPDVPVQQVERLIQFWRLDSEDKTWPTRGVKSQIQATHAMHSCETARMVHTRLLQNVMKPYPTVWYNNARFSLEYLSHKDLDNLGLRLEDSDNDQRYNKLAASSGRRYRLWRTYYYGKRAVFLQLDQPSLSRLAHEKTSLQPVIVPLLPSEVDLDVKILTDVLRTEVQKSRLGLAKAVVLVEKFVMQLQENSDEKWNGCLAELLELGAVRASRTSWVHKTPAGVPERTLGRVMFDQSNKVLEHKCLPAYNWVHLQPRIKGPPVTSIPRDPVGLMDALANRRLVWGRNVVRKVLARPNEQGGDAISSKCKSILAFLREKESRLHRALMTPRIPQQIRESHVVFSWSIYTDFDDDTQQDVRFLAMMDFLDAQQAAIRESESLVSGGRKAPT